MVVLIEIRTLHDKVETAYRTSTLREKTSELIINDTQEWYSIISLERTPETHGHAIKEAWEWERRP